MPPASLIKPSFDPHSCRTEIPQGHDAQKDQHIVRKTELPTEPTAGAVAQPEK
jgi:hypothetical protein